VSYLSAAEIAKKWAVSERSVRNYCAQGRVPGAFLTGKTWNIPEDAEKPSRRPRAGSEPAGLLEYLLREKESRLPGGIYHRVQIDLTYNSNHIEGSRLSHEQTRYIFETSSIGPEEQPLHVDDIVETVNHFRCIDLVLERARQPLRASFIRELHAVLKASTGDSRKDWFAVGEYKRLPNQVGGRETTPPEQVAAELRKLLQDYNASPQKSLEELIEFHVRFEEIHPFQDGNGRIGRLILFKECLRNRIVPFIISEELKLFYYRGLQQWHSERGYLLDTCLSAQDQFKQLLEYYRIPYGE